MLLIISPEELVEKFRDAYRMQYVKSLHIDYATNAIHGWYENEDVIIFKFRDLGWINDNRYNTYEISSGPAGIIVKITRKSND
jgi:hypothetical protein